MDRNFYYDFSGEPAIKNWRTDSKDGGEFILSSEFTAKKNGFYTLLFSPLFPQENWDLISVEASGKTFSREETSIAYISPEAFRGFRYAFSFDLPAGKHRISMRVRSDIQPPESGFKATWLAGKKSGRPTPLPGAGLKNMRLKEGSGAPAFETGGVKPGDLDDFLPGAGSEKWPAAGRFGFTKGDGVLDCAMPVLGIIDRMYLCGHPEYKKPFKWTCSVLPPGINRKSAYHGSLPPAVKGLEEDEISVNHLSASWKASFKAEEDFFERRAGATIDFSCSYSLASPAILVETGDPGLSLSMLEYAGDYQFLLAPCGGGLECFALEGEISFPEGLSENWLLVFGAKEFPDVPILLVFTRPVSEAGVVRNNLGRLTALDFHIPSGGSEIFLAAPFGIESLHPPVSDGFIDEAVERCRFWSRAFLAYPVRCLEYFKLWESEQKVEIFQQFEYRKFTDSWGTVPLETAPIPPVLSLLDGAGAVEADKDIIDFKFPTKYGFLRGSPGRSFATYKIPYMPRERRFPLREAGNFEISRLLSEGMDDCFRFHERFGTDSQGTPYAGSLLDPYAWPATMFNFMDGQVRSKLSEKLAERLALVLDPERRYTYPVVNWSDMMSERPGPERVLEIYSDPGIKTFQLYNWYPRKEPFTGTGYRICYLNVGLFSGGVVKEGAREEIAAMTTPLVENDWGAGLALYFIYLAAQVSGDFSHVRKNWQIICEAFAYFEKLHDWGCMAAAYSDNGITWVEGANYGAFPAFINLAEAVGDCSAQARGEYLAAKQMILRLGQLRSAEVYFPRFFNHDPWYTTKFFHEEASPGNAFQNVPELWKKIYRRGSVFNLTAEGLYPEICEAMYRFLPEEFSRLRDIALESYKQGLGDFCSDNLWVVIAENSFCLMAGALSEDNDSKKLLKEIEEAEERGHLLKKWRGMHVYSRLLPENYFKCQLLAWMESRNHPAWLEYWVDVRITGAEYAPEAGKAVIAFEISGEKPVIRLGCRVAPSRVLLNSREIDCGRGVRSKLEVKPVSPGRLEIFFE